MILLKLYIVYLINLFYLGLMFRNFCINKVIWSKGNHGSIYFKDTKSKNFILLLMSRILIKWHLLMTSESILGQRKC